MWGWSFQMEFGVGEGRECGADWGKTTNSNVI